MCLDRDVFKTNPQAIYPWPNGVWSPIYFNSFILLEQLNDIRDQVIDWLAATIKTSFQDDYDIITGISTTGISWATLLAIKLNKTCNYVRPFSKKHAKKNMIEGVFKPGDKVILIDDCFATGQTTARLFHIFKDQYQLQVTGIVSLFSYDPHLVEKFWTQLQVKICTLIDINDVLNHKPLTNDESIALMTFFKQLHTTNQMSSLKDL